MENIIGIDPGKSGAIVVIECSDSIFTHVMPLIGDKELDIGQLRDLLKRFMPGHVYLEDVHAIFGSAAGATFTFGKICGAIEATLLCCDIPFTKIQPKKWQAEVYQGIPEIRKPSIIIKAGKRAGQTIKGKLDCKAMSEIAAKRLFPGVDLRASSRCKNSHDGIVDALLIAEYGRRKRIK